MSELLLNVSVRIWYTIPERGAHAEFAAVLVSVIDAMIKAFGSNDGEAVQKAMQGAIQYYTEKLKQLF